MLGNSLVLKVACAAPATTTRKLDVEGNGERDDGNVRFTDRLWLRDDCLAEAARLAGAGVWQRLNCCSRSCTPPASSTGRARSPTRVRSRRKKGARERVPTQLSWTLTGGNRNDVTQPLALLDLVPPVRRRAGRPRRRPERIVADRGYDHDKYRRLLPRQGIKPAIARRETEHGSGLGRERWVVERTFAWLHNRRRLPFAPTVATRSTRPFSRSPAA
jgi:transposase